jgi:hypothetical protein
MAGSSQGHRTADLSVGVLVDPRNPFWAAYLRSVQLAAPSFNVELIPTDIGTDKDIEQAIGGSARSSNVGLLVLPAPVTLLHRELIVKLSIQDRVPTVFPCHELVINL